MVWYMVSSRSHHYMRGESIGVRDLTSVANEQRQILWPDGDDAISSIDAAHITRRLSNHQRP